jgi:cob(I)alamin adenosyltransferase
VLLLKIYTKTGDKGTTADVLGNRISKADIKIELQGSIDEINASVGYLRALLKAYDIAAAELSIDLVLRDIQYTLFRIGGDISSDFSFSYVKDEDISFLEQSIDTMTTKVGQLQNFIYYSGSQPSTYCQLIRSITRRAERVFVRHMDGKEYNLDYQYINRLSDFFFTLGRYLNHLTEGTEEAMILR